MTLINMVLYHNSERKRHYGFDTKQICYNNFANSVCMINRNEKPLFKNFYKLPCLSHKLGGKQHAGTETFTKLYAISPAVCVL